MSLYEIIRLFYYNKVKILIAALLPPMLIFFLTSNLPKEYQASAMLYTGIASGYTLESGENERIDYHRINNAFDNLIGLLKSRETMEQVGLMLLAQHLMLEEPNKYQLGHEGFENLQQVVSDKHRKEWVADSSVALTFARLHRAYQQGSSPVLQTLCTEEGSPYSFKTLAKIEVKRVKSSDMILVAYRSSDPALCTSTLNVLLDVFIHRYRDLKESETNNVVAYFEEQLDSIKIKLTTAEDHLTGFRSDNGVINYGEQTKALAIKKQNALEVYSNKKMGMQANESALAAIEDKLSMRESLLARNATVIEIKQELSEVTAQLARAALDSTYGALHALEARQRELRSQMQTELVSAFNAANSRSGITTQQLLNDWLSHVITLEKEKTEVKLFGQRLAELDTEYERFAPLGSTIDRYEREIDVFEREYLEILRGLNMAKLRQQNLQLASTLKVIDAPIFPKDPLASKRKLLVVAGFLAGFIGVISIIIAFELFDPTLQSPLKAKSQTGLPLAGALPVCDDRFRKTFGNDLERQLLRLTLNKIKSQIPDASAPLLIGITSTSPRAGKTEMMQRLHEEVTAQPGQSLILSSKGQAEEAQKDGVTYLDPTKDTNLQHLLSKTETKDLRYIFIELPCLLEGNRLPSFINDLQLIVTVETPLTIWREPQMEVIQNLRDRLRDQPLLLFLNGIKPRFLDQVVGEVPKKRNKLVELGRSLLRGRVTRQKI